MAVGYEQDIKPLFTQLDRDHMLEAKGFDLYSYPDTKKWAKKIYAAVKSHDMPPANSEPEAPWPDTKVALFKQWMDEGSQP